MWVGKIKLTSEDLKGLGVWVLNYRAYKPLFWEETLWTVSSIQMYVPFQASTPSLYKSLPESIFFIFYFPSFVALQILTTNGYFLITDNQPHPKNWDLSPATKKRK